MVYEAWRGRRGQGGRAAKKRKLAPSPPKVPALSHLPGRAARHEGQRRLSQRRGVGPRRCHAHQPRLKQGRGANARGGRARACQPAAAASPPTAAGASAAAQRLQQDARHTGVLRQACRRSEASIAPPEGATHGRRCCRGCCALRKGTDRTWSASLRGRALPPPPPPYMTAGRVTREPPGVHLTRGHCRGGATRPRGAPVSAVASRCERSLASDLTIIRTVVSSGTVPALAVPRRQPPWRTWRTSPPSS